MNAQRTKVRKLADEIIEFNPNSVYYHIKLKDLGELLREEGTETEDKVRKHISRRIMFSDATAFFGYVAASVGLLKLISEHETHVDLKKTALIAACLTLGSLARKVSQQSSRMGNNWHRVDKETRRQYREESNE